MPRFMAVHTAPITEEQLVQLAAVQSNPPFPIAAGTRWIQTYCGFADGKFFCDWEAPNSEAVQDVLKNAKVPYDAIYPVRMFDVAKSALEPESSAVAG